MTKFQIVTDEDLFKLRLFNRSRLAENGCWIWFGPKDRAGYGMFNNGGRTVRVHRLSFEAYKGPIPKGLVICHSCDNRACINPAHLRADTQQANIAERTARGRGHKMKGEQIGTSKLTESQVREIRASVDMSLRDIAERYGIDKSNAWAIRAGKSWKHVSTDAPSTDKELGDAR